MKLFLVPDKSDDKHLTITQQNTKEPSDLNRKLYETICDEAGLPIELSNGENDHIYKEASHTKVSKDGYNDSMTTSPSREEIHAKLEAVEARMDGRVANMSAKLDATLVEMRADRETNNIRAATVVAAIEAMKTNLAVVSQDAKDQSKSVKANVWTAAVAIISIVGATLAIAISSFDSGRETSKNIAEAAARMEKLQAALEAKVKQEVQTSQVPVSPRK
ncbi:hypothetical protein [Comamonas humi]